jgi:hypothetical protein
MLQNISDRRDIDLIFGANEFLKISEKPKDEEYVDK